METFSKVLILLAAFVAGPAFSQEIAGVWQGKLNVTPQSLNIRSTHEKTDGSYAAVRTPGCHKDVAANRSRGARQ